MYSFLRGRKHQLPAKRPTTQKAQLSQCCRLSCGSGELESSFEVSSIESSKYPVLRAHKIIHEGTLCVSTSQTQRLPRRSSSRAPRSIQRKIYGRDREIKRTDPDKVSKCNVPKRKWDKEDRGGSKSAGVITKNTGDSHKDRRERERDQLIIKGKNQGGTVSCHFLPTVR